MTAQPARASRVRPGMHVLAAAVAALLLVACGAGASPTAPGAGVVLRACPAAVAGGGCFALTPAETGLQATGTNARVDQYALQPATGSARPPRRPG